MFLCNYIVIALGLYAPFLLCMYQVSLGGYCTTIKLHLYPPASHAKVHYINDSTLRGVERALTVSVVQRLERACTMSLNALSHTQYTHIRVPKHQRVMQHHYQKSRHEVQSNQLFQTLEERMFKLNLLLIKDLQQVCGYSFGPSVH